MKKEKNDSKPVCPLKLFPKQDDPGNFDLNVILDSGESVLGIMDLQAAVNLTFYLCEDKL